MAEYSGVEPAAAAGLQNTGVNGVQVAAGQGQMEYPPPAEHEEAAEYIEQQTPPEDTEPVLTFEDILAEDSGQQTVVKGDDAQQPQQPAPKPAEQPAPAQQPELPPDASKAFSARLNAERPKIEQQVRAEYGGLTPDEVRELALEKRAREMVDKYPQQVPNVEFAKEILRGQQPTPQPAPQAKPAQEQTTSGQDQAAIRAEFARQVDTIRLIDAGFNPADYKDNPYFKAALLEHGSVIAAYNAAKTAASQTNEVIENAKKQGQQEAISAVRKSGQQAMAPITSGKGQQPTNRPTTLADREKIRAAAKMGYSIANPYYDGSDT